MGYLRPTAIIVSAGYGEPHWILRAHRKAREVFGVNDGTYDLSVCVTEPTDEAVNNERSFLIAWDGSKEGWDISDAGDVARAEFIAWCRAQAYDDGSSPIHWVEVQYGGDDAEAIILDHADAQRAPLSGASSSAAVTGEDPS